MNKFSDLFDGKFLGLETIESRPETLDFSLEVNEKVGQSLCEEAVENLTGESNAHYAERLTERDSSSVKLQKLIGNPKNNNYDLDKDSCHKCPKNNRGDIPIPRTECNNQAIDDADIHYRVKTLEYILQAIGQYTKRYVRENEARILRDIFHQIFDSEYLELAPVINDIEGRDESERRNIIINDIHHNANQVMDF